jgi:hypothetical protein
MTTQLEELGRIRKHRSAAVGTQVPNQVGSVSAQLTQFQVSTPLLRVGGHCQAFPRASGSGFFDGLCPFEAAEIGSASMSAKLGNLLIDAVFNLSTFGVPGLRDDNPNESTALHVTPEIIVVTLVMSHIVKELKLSRNASGHRFAPHRRACFELITPGIGQYS